jgi:hypothetical protein
MGDLDVSFRVDTHIMKEIMKNTPAAIEEFLDKEAEAVVNDVKLSMQQSPPIGPRYGMHVASAAGNAPRIHLGNLVNAIDWAADGKFRRVVYDAVGYGGYWQYLELGIGMDARPSLGPAFERERRLFARHAESEGLIKA